MIDGRWSNLQIVVLAAGFSSRLGQPKTLARVHGVSLIRRTIGVLTQVTRQPIFVVVPQRSTQLREELRRSRVSLLKNAARADGLSASVTLALRRTRYSSGTLFLPADLPRLSPRDIARLIARWRVHRRRVVARSVAGRASTPLILPTFLYSRAQHIRGDVGLRDFVAAVSAEHRILIELSSAAFDVDTPEDLANARRWHAAPLGLPKRS